MSGADRRCQLRLEGIHVRPQRRDPVGVERVQQQGTFGRSDIGRGQQDPDRRVGAHLDMTSLIGVMLSSHPSAATASYPFPNVRDSRTCNLVEHGENGVTGLLKIPGDQAVDGNCGGNGRDVAKP